MTHDVNLLILANRQVHAQLMSRVRSAEARRVKEDRARWEERLAAWRQLRHDQALNAFKTYLHSDQVVQPAARAKLLGEIAEQQTSFHARREATLGSLGGLTPPALTEAAATEVRGQLEAQLSDARIERIGAVAPAYAARSLVVCATCAADAWLAAGGGPTSALVVVIAWVVGVALLVPLVCMPWVFGDTPQRGVLLIGVAGASAALGT